MSRKQKHPSLQRKFSSITFLYTVCSDTSLRSERMEDPFDVRLSFPPFLNTKSLVLTPSREHARTRRLFMLTYARDLHARARETRSERERRR